MSNVKKLRKKMNQQRFRKRRGAFTPVFGNRKLSKSSEASTLDLENGFADPKLAQFWAERTSPKSMGVSRVGIPLGLQDTFNYRAHAKDRSRIEWLDTLFPGADMTSEERSAVNRRIQELKIPADPTACVVVAITKNTRLLLYYTTHKDSWWYIHTHVLSDRRLVVKQSITFSSKSQAEATRLSLQLRWHQPHIIPPS
jgi:hypothetical protein